MIIRLTIRSAIVLSAALAAIGCSGNRFGSQFTTLGHSSPTAESIWPLAQAPQSEKGSSLKSLLAVGRLNERRGQTAQAERIYDVVIAREPQNPIPYHRLGVMCAKEGRFSDADRHFARAHQLAPSNPDLLSDMGYSHYLQHRLPEAEEILRRALEMKPNDPAICNNLGLVVAEQGRDKECMALFRQTNTDAQACANLAFVYTQRGELEKAKANYSRALTLNQELRPAAEAMIQLAQHEQLHRRAASTPWTPQPELQSAPGPVRVRLGSVRPVQAPPQPIDAQQAAFFNQQPRPGVPDAASRLRTAIYEQSSPPPVTGREVPAAQIRGAR